MIVEVIAKEKVAAKEKVIAYPISMGRRQPSSRPCPGCHYGIITRIVAECIDELGIQRNLILLKGIGCHHLIAERIEADSLGCPHGPAADSATALKRIHPDAIVVTVQGDGDLGAIGLGSFMSALQRAELLTTILLNNAMYGTTGGQMGPTTLVGQVTPTSPTGRDPKTSGYPIHVAELAAMFKGVAFSARCSVHTPANRMKAKIAMKTALEKQIRGIGYSFVEFLSACPTNWGMPPRQCLAFISEKMLGEYALGVFKDVNKIE